jgi:hypothetical protein
MVQAAPYMKLHCSHHPLLLLLLLLCLCQQSLL